MAANLNQANPFSLLDDLILPEKPEDKSNDDGTDRFIMHSQQIDTHTIKRTRVKLTPAVCEKCGLDLLRLAYSQNKTSTDVFEDLPEEIQVIMPQLVAKHKQIQHSIADDLIITHRPKKWLSGRQV